ncbi:MAG: DUF4012 domain-containing protein [Actinomycetota bacterium]
MKPPSAPWHSSARVRAGALVGGLLLLAALPTALGAWNLIQARNAFLGAAAAAKTLDIAHAREGFSRGGLLASAAEERLNNPVVVLAQKLPFIGDDIRMVRALATGARQLAPAALRALKVADVFPRGPDGPRLGLIDGRLDLQPWPAAGVELKLAAEAIRNSLAQLDLLPQDRLFGPVAGAYRAFAAQGSEAARTLDTAGDAVSLIPHFFGGDGPRTWFLFLQNPTELRGTGGFLGAFGILHAEQGNLSLDRLEDNAALPAISGPPPTGEEFARHYDQFGTRIFWPNSNFSPDFPTSAGLMAALWEQETGQHLDGVIAVDAIGLNYLLALVGPIDVPPIGQMNSSNFLEFALNRAYIEFPDRTDRSRALREVGLGVWTRLLSGSFSNLGAQVGALSEMIATKRIQVWSPAKQGVLEGLGIAGELRPEPGADYLMVVANNAGGNKLDYYSRRKITYRAHLGRGTGFQGDVSVEISNTAPDSGLPPYILGLYPEFPPGLLRAYTSVFMPQTATLRAAGINLEASPDLDGHREKGLQAVSTFVPVESRSKSLLQLSTARRMQAPGEYRLIVQQQASLHPDQFELEIYLPDRAEVTQVSEGMQVEGRRVTWRGYLSREREFLVRYEPHSTPPRL